MNYFYANLGRIVFIAVLGGLVSCKQHPSQKTGKSIENTKVKDSVNPGFPAHEAGDYQLVWREEFNYTGKPDPEKWRFEKGFVRNKEEQWYQKDNAEVKNGVLTITARPEKIKNPDYDSNNGDWRKNRKYAQYTSSAIETYGKKKFHYGSIVIKAKIDTVTGSWPAIWTLGVNGQWPDNGEIDIMEFYQVDQQPTILANVNWGTWSTTHHKLDDFLKKDPHWSDKFHIWRMDWNKEGISLYLDNKLMNQVDFAKEKPLNADGENPFLKPHYLLLNLAVDKRVEASEINFPIQYQVDYVRYYKKK